MQKVVKKNESGDVGRSGEEYKNTFRLYMRICSAEKEEKLPKGGWVESRESSGVYEKPIKSPRRGEIFAS